LTPSARSANLTPGDGTKNGLPAPNKELSAKTKNNDLTGKAPYKFESAFLQRGVTCEPDFFDRRWPAGTIRGPSAHRTQAEQGWAASIAILNHIADSRLVLLNNCGH